jgi:hypothetical protein
MTSFAYPAKQALLTLTPILQLSIVTWNHGGWRNAYLMEGAVTQSAVENPRFAGESTPRQMRSRQLDTPTAVQYLPFF